jgi:fumarate hydratase subunit alpha
MRRIEYQTIVQAVKNLCISAAHRLPEDVVQGLQKAAIGETDSRAKHILNLLLENAKVAEEELYPLCQDTGLAVIFVRQGNDVFVEGGLAEAINEGVKAGYQEGFLRKSVVADPLFNRVNTGTNTPAIIHHSFVPGDQLEIAVMLKGGGCENRSQFRMLTPAQGQEGVENFVVEVVRQAGADACPPFVVGVGIGGNFEVSCMLAKKALLRSLDSVHPVAYYAEMEKKLFRKINELGIGPQGIGGKTTALGIFIEIFPCHIASLPVAINIECHSHRHGRCLL